MFSLQNLEIKSPQETSVTFQKLNIKKILLKGRNARKLNFSTYAVSLADTQVVSQVTVVYAQSFQFHQDSLSAGDLSVTEKSTLSHNNH